MDKLVIAYRFIFPDNDEETFRIELDPKTLEPTGVLPKDLPDWTVLDFHKCPNCPLSSQTHPHCPLSARIVNIVDRFGEVMSYEEVRVVVNTPERRIGKKTSAQVAVSALLGLVMATSGCPHMAYFKPMAAFHLPLANPEETVYRAVSMYLMAQYYIKKQGGEPDLTLDGLRKIYGNIEILNLHMAKRVRAAIRRDATVNAIVILDFFAKNITAIVEQKLDELAPLFQVYTE